MKYIQKAMTVLIAVAAAAIGLVLAYGLVFIRRRNNPIANRLISGYNSLIAGIPAAVILMALYYDRGHEGPARD